MTNNINEIIYNYRWQLSLFLIGLSLVGFGILSSKINFNNSSEIEIIEPSDSSNIKELIVEVGGAVNNPGVYSFLESDRINDALLKAGGLSENANNQWVDKTLNKAAMLKDGQKIYIPSSDEQSNQETANISRGNTSINDTLGTTISNKININESSQKELESMWGIGPVTAQNIIEHRPYSTIEELLEKKIVKSNVYERNKDILSVY